MADIRLQQLARDWKTTGDPESLDSYLAALSRSGLDEQAEQIIKNLLLPYDIPYRMIAKTHVLPILYKNKRSVMAFSLQSGAGLNTERKNFTLINDNETGFIRPPATAGGLLRLIPERLAWDMLYLRDQIEAAMQSAIEYVNEQYGEGHSVEIVMSSRTAPGFSGVEATAYSHMPQAWTWQLTLHREFNTPYRASLTLVRNPFMDNLEFVCEDNLFWGSENEVQGLRISGECYHEYGIHGPDYDDIDDVNRYEDMDHYDVITDLDRLQERMQYYFMELFGF